MLEHQDFVDEFDEALHVWAATRELPQLIENVDEELIYQLIEVLFFITKHHFSSGRATQSPFSFTANQTLSGWDTPCGALECRLSKIDQMLSFSALYADEVYVRNPFEEMYRDCKRQGVLPKIRQELLTSISIYWVLRPYLKVGIVKYANSAHAFCSEHIESIVKPASVKLRKNEDLLFNALVKHYLDKISVSYDESEDYGFLTVIGPESLIEHKRKYLHLYDNSADFFHDFRNLGLPYKLSPDEIKNDGVMDILLHPLVDDVSFYSWHSKFYNTNLLTNDDLQVKILNRLNVNAVNPDIITNQFQHTLIVAENTTPETVLSLRHANEEHFNVYRERTKQFLSAVNGLKPNEQEEAYSDLVRSEIANIERNLRTHKTKYLSKARQNLIFGTGVLTVGAYAGIIPTDLASFLATIGGTSAVASMLTDVNQQFLPDSAAQDNDFYFLWKLRK
ncbi:hypothetical protein [Vibrio sp. WZ-1]|uniref:hypothetical protein n=1 Tax=Vibrio sp. WZ-1 TaxID=3454501 RepID=UPI003F854F70